MVRPAAMTFCASKKLTVPSGAIATSGRLNSAWPNRLKFKRSPDPRVSCSCQAARFVEASAEKEPPTGSDEDAAGVGEEGSSAASDGNCCQLHSRRRHANQRAKRSCKLEGRAWLKTAPASRHRDCLSVCT